MITTTKMLMDTIPNNIDSLSKASAYNTASKSTSELYKVYDKKTTSEFETSKRDDFKDVLDSKTKIKNDDAKEDPKNLENINENEVTNESEDTTKIDELKEKLKELDEEDSKSASKDDVNDILTELLSLLAKLGIKEEDLNSDGKVNSDILKTIVDGINGDKSSKSNLNSVMEKMLELLKADSVKDGLDTDSLKMMQKVLSNLSASLADDKTEATKDIKSGLKSLVSEISNMLEHKENKSGKVLTLEDMLNKNYSQDNKDSSLENESNKKSMADATKNNKEVSKEDKFLNSLINDDKDSSLNKINLFASRTQTIQNQGVNAARGLTINKAIFADDLIKDVKFMSNNGLKELTVKVNPGNLGEITIRLVQEDGLMKANLKANSKETSELLSQNLTDIKKQLGEQNIKISDVNIELYQDDTTFFKQQGFEGQLSQEQERSNSSKNNKINNVTASEQEVIENEAVNNSNLDFLA